MIFLLIAVSDSCAGSAGNTGWAASPCCAAGWGGGCPGTGASGDSGHGRSPAPVNAPSGHISYSEANLGRQSLCSHCPITRQFCPHNNTFLSALASTLRVSINPLSSRG